MSTTAGKKDRTILQFIVFCVIAALGWILPAPAPITTEGMHLIGVFVAAIYGWSVSTEVWPSLATLILIPLTGMTTPQEFLANSWGSDTVWFIVLLFVLVSFLEVTGTTGYVAAFLMTRKSLAGHPWRLIFMIFICAWVLSTFCGNFPGMLITWGFIYKICDVLGYKPFDKFANLLIFGVAVMGALSLSAVPWANNALVILSAYTASSGQQINYLHYLAYSIPFGIFSILGFMLICKFIFRLDVTKLKELDPNLFGSSELKLTAERKTALIGLAALIIILVVPSLLPADNPIRVLSTSLGLSMKTALVFLVLSFIKIDGKYVFKFGELATKGVPWNMVMMTCGIMCFVGLLGSEKAGIGAFLGQVFTPLFQNTSVIVFFLLTLLITIFLTNFMINMVVAVIMITATMPIATGLGVDPLQIVYLITVSCTIAFMLPAASAASCCLFANTKWVRAKDVYKYSVPTIILLAVIAFVWDFILFLF